MASPSYNKVSANHSRKSNSRFYINLHPSLTQSDTSVVELTLVMPLLLGLAGALRGAILLLVVGKDSKSSSSFGMA